MQDFFCTDPDDMHFRELAKKTRYFKQSEEGKAAMCKVLEDMRKEAADRAVWDEKVDTVFRLLELNLSHEQIAQGTGLAVEQVKEIAGQRSA